MTDKLKKLFYDLPLLGKLLLLLLLCSILPLTLISVYSYLSARDQLLEQAYENMDHTNRQINNNIANQLETIQQISGMLYTNSTLKAYLTMDYERGIDIVDAYDYINDLFYGLMAANSRLHSICIYVKNESLPTDGTFIKHLYDDQTPSWIHTLNKSYGNLICTEIHGGPHGERLLSLGRIMNFGSLNYSYGVLTISVSEEFIYSMLGQEAEFREIYVVNEKGNIISARDKSLLSNSLEQVIGQNLPSAPHGHQLMQIHGTPSLIVYNSMSQGWKTVSIVPLSDLLQETREATSQILLVSLVSFTLAFSLIWLIAHYFNTRIQNLSRQISRIENEDFNSRIVIQGNDEIGQLSHAFNAMTERLNTLINELYKKEIARRDTELYALQSQINPHFLYNTLSVISSLAIRNGDVQISRLIAHLSSFYRTSLNKGKRYISIKDELDITRHYLSIQHMRFGDRFTEHYELDEQLFPYRTLKLVLQPFLENTINHGFGEKQKQLHITVKLYRQNQHIFFEITDDGIGISPERLRQIQTGSSAAGYGIHNVRERLRLAYGDFASLSLESCEGEGTVVRLCLPL